MKKTMVWWFSFCLMTDGKSLKRETESTFSPDCSGNPFLFQKRLQRKAGGVLKKI